MRPIEVVLIDFEDSFSQNIAHELPQRGVTVKLFTLPRRQSPSAKLLAALGSCDGVVLSPGPGRAGDYNTSRLFEKLKRELPRLPVLGVCLGHQMLLRESGLTPRRIEGHFFHGRVEPLCQEAQLPFPFHEICPQTRVVYYNSLHCPWPGANTGKAANKWHMVPSADQPPGIALACHRVRPWFGLQFHPESYATAQGISFLEAFLQVCRDPH